MQDASRQDPRQSRALALLVVLAVIAVYLPSLAGGWVWDDWHLLGANPALDSPALLLTKDIWGPTGREVSDLYRPLVMISHALPQLLWRGPLTERLVNLGFHLLCVVSLARIARRAGIALEPAWLAAALFGLHPAASETVAWITGRHDLLPALLTVLALERWSAGRAWLAGCLLALTPFCKESYLVVPAVALVWGLGRRTLDLRLLSPAVAGVIAYLAIRHGLGLALPHGAAAVAPWGPVGALGLRGLELALDPTAPDAMQRYAAAPLVGGGIVALAVGLLVASWGRQVLAWSVGCALVLGPAALASPQLGLIADRYFYLPLAVACVGIAVLLGGRRHWRVAWLVPVLLGGFTAQRAGDWASDRRLFAASLERDPTNPYAAFHLAHDLHTRGGDCESAIPLYRAGIEVEARAATNLLACLVGERRFDEAAALGPDLIERYPGHVSIVVNNARALASLGRNEQAVASCRSALDQAPERCDLWIMLGNLQGMQGALAEAGAAFTRALDLGGPCVADARRGLDLVERKRAEERPSDQTLE